MSKGPTSQGDATWRRHLVDNAEVLTRQLWHVGISEIFLDGSFVEDKDRPNDIDGYFEEVISAQREQLHAVGLSGSEVERALQPAMSFHDQLKEEVETFERMKRRDFQIIENLNHIGRILIGLRIAADISQADLARRLGVSESLISRDERNEYQGISVERAQRIVDALNGRLTLSVEQEIADREAVGAV